MHQDDWDRIRIALFRPDEPPSEAFVGRVMARIDGEELTAQSSELRWFELSSGNWLAPALGFAFAGLLLFYARPRLDVEPFPDAVIQSAAFSDLQARWSLAAEPQTVYSQEEL